MTSGFCIFDDVLPDPLAYRRAALEVGFHDVVLGGQTFKGVASVPDRAVVEFLEAVCPVKTTLTFFRQSPTGQQEPNFLHSDVSMGEWTAIYYMTPSPPAADGTTFWEHRETKARESADHAAWADLRAWQPWKHVRAVFNRAILFPAGWVHSRALVENYGAGDAARLVQVAFGHWTHHGG